MTDTQSALQLTDSGHSVLLPQLDYIVVDGSSSMKDKWWDFMDSLEAYVQTLRDNSVRSRIICSVFDDHNVDMRQRDCQLSDWQSLRSAPLESNWTLTPLYDAINAMGRNMRDLNPQSASIVIVTDGGECSSRYTDLTQARAILDWCKAKGWQITFIGCDFNNQKQAEALGITDQNSIGVAKAQLTNAARNLGEKRTRHARTGADMHFSDDEKQQFGGYLAPPRK